MKQLLFLGALLLLALPVQAQTHPNDLTFPALPDFEIPQAEKVTLDNGMILFLIEDDELPLISMSARIGGGALHEPVEQTGLANIFGQVMRDGGTTTMSGDAMNEALENIGASVETGAGGSSMSASLSTLKEHIDMVLPIFADVLQNPAFPEDKLSLAKTQTRSGISRRNDDPQQIANRELNQLLYGETSPYATTPEYFTVDAISRDDLVAFHERYFHPNNVILGVWGDFETDEMVAKLKAAFGGWVMNPDFVRPQAPPVPTNPQRSVNLASKTDINQSTVLIGHVGEVLFDDPDYPAIQVMNNVLGGGFYSRLFGEVRTNQGLAYAVFGNYSGGYEAPGQFYAGVMTKSESTVDAAQSVLREVERMREAPPTAEEVQLAKDDYLNSFVFNFDTRSEIVNRMMTYEYYGYPTDFLERVKSGIEATTPDDVLRVSQAYLKPDQATVVVVGNPTEFGEPLTAMGAVNDIDLTIPTEAPGSISDEDKEAGAVLMAQAVEAMGGDAFDAIENMQVKTTDVQQTPMGEMTMETEMSVVLPTTDTALAMSGDDQIAIMLETPMGEMSIVMSDGQGVMRAPQGSQPIPPSQMGQFKGQLWRNLTYLMRNAEQVTATAMGQESIDGAAYDVVKVQPPQGDAFTLLLDADTKRPMRMRYVTPNPMTGAEVQAEEVYSDFRTVDGVLVPFKTDATAAGNPAGGSTVVEVLINTDLDASLFSIE
ncbi:MAG: pitrilysin family protein [Rhodothermales bacterium]